MSDIIPGVLLAVQSATFRIDELVREGRIDELCTVTEVMAVENNRLLALSQHQTNEIDRVRQKQEDHERRFEEFHATMELLDEEKGYMRGELRRLAQEKHHLERMPKLQHVLMAVVQCEEEYRRLIGRVTVTTEGVSTIEANFLVALRELSTEARVLVAASEETLRAAKAINTVLLRMPCIVIGVQSVKRRVLLTTTTADDGLPIMSSLISDVLNSVRSAEMKIDELVQHGKKDELHALHGDMIVEDKRVTRQRAQNRRAFKHIKERRDNYTKRLEEVRVTVELLADEKVFLRNEVVRLIEDQRRLEHEPMLRHVYFATLQCAVDYYELQEHVEADLKAADASIGEILEEIEEWDAEVASLEHALDKTGAAADAIMDVFEKLKEAEASLVARREYTSTPLNCIDPELL
ncbi:hypothetical protein PENSPDRAFT_684162 [Peniophora sp. CONT]|nr:hypothetical protein PENSPDRAFT_684162 [Peniophora sp. CONT]